VFHACVLAIASDYRTIADRVDQTVAWFVAAPSFCLDTRARNSFGHLAHPLLWFAVNSSFGDRQHPR